ncbi:MAG: hypothetical protein M3Y57_03510 [Acidobacteriota bacterium]|nr:hypothetical protein [Acidobacteriota bacterium]
MRVVAIVLFLAIAAQAMIIDRIAIIAGNAIIKDSDIERDIRVNDLLNGEPVSLDPISRKQAASRLLEQNFIRREIRIGDYRTATPETAIAQLAALKKQKFRTDAAYNDALRRAGINNMDLQNRFQGQLTILNFIDARFKPAAYVTDQEIESYYNAHAAALKRQFPGKASLNALQPDIRNILAEEKVNQLFFAWLDQQRKDTKITYLEDNLR